MPDWAFSLSNLCCCAGRPNAKHRTVGYVFVVVIGGLSKSPRHSA